MTDELKDSSIVTAISVVGFVFGLIALLGSLIPFLGAIVFCIGIPAVIISIIGLAIAYSKNAKRTFAVVAVTISILGVAISGWQYFTIVSIGEKAKRALTGNVSQHSSQPSKSTMTAAIGPVEEFELDNKIKKIDFTTHGNLYSITPDTDIKISYNSRCGYIKEQTLNFKVYRSKTDRSSFKVKLTGKVDREACMNSNITPISYESKNNFTINENNSEVLISMIHPSIQSVPSKCIVSHPLTENYLIYNKALYGQQTPRGDIWGKKIDDITYMAIDPENEKIFYVITTNNKIMKSMDMGSKWITIDNGLEPNTSYYSIVINPHANSEVFATSSKGLFKTDDAGFSWSKLNTPEFVLQFLIDPKNPNLYYANTLSGLIYSTDSGATWTAIETGQKDKIRMIALLHDETSSLLTFSLKNGAMITRDFGKTWGKIGNNFDPGDGIYSLQTNDTGLYVGAYGCIYYLANDMDSWQKFDLESEPNSPTAIVGLIALGDNSFMILDDSNRLNYVTPEMKLVGLNYGVMPHSKVLAITSGDICSEKRLCAVVQNDNYTDTDSYGLFFSNNNGKTWIKSLIYDRPYHGGQPTIYMSPHDNNEMRIIEYGDGAVKHITYDGGVNWSLYGLSLKYRNDYVYDFIYDPSDPNIMYACNGVNGSWLFMYKQNESTKEGKWIGLDVDAKMLLVNLSDHNKLLTNHLNISLDGGWTWNSLKGNLKDRISDSILPILFTGNRIVFASKYNDAIHIFESHDLGNSWNIIKKLTDKRIHQLYVNKANRENLLVVSDNKESGNKNPIVKVSESLDCGKTWKRIYTEKLYNLNGSEIVKSLYISDDEGKHTIYIGTVSGMKMSTDNGSTWEILGGIIR